MSTDTLILQVARAIAAAYGDWWQDAADDVSLTDDYTDGLTVGDVRRAEGNTR